MADTIQELIWLYVLLPIFSIAISAPRHVDSVYSGSSVRFNQLTD